MCPRPAKRWRAHGDRTGARRACRRRGFLRVPDRARCQEVPVAPTQATVRKSDAVWTITDLKDRLLYRQAVRQLAGLSENVLTSVHDANIGSIFGIGFPAWTGGAMQFIYGMGVGHSRPVRADLARQFGDGLRCPTPSGYHPAVSNPCIDPRNSHHVGPLAAHPAPAPGPHRCRAGVCAVPRLAGGWLAVAAPLATSAACACCRPGRRATAKALRYGGSAAG